MARRKRRRRQRFRPASVGMLWVAVACVATGLLVYTLFDQVAALVLSLVGIAVFVIVAWRSARPERGGDVGHPDINPWTVGR